jgi:curved DNA-binding protein CbpA
LFIEIDAYRILQIDPRAETFVLAAAYRALARQYHPDGVTPDISRMAEINRAYALVRTPDDRRRYDSDRMKPVGPAQTPVPDSVVVAAASRFDSWARRSQPPGDTPSDGSSVLPFGRYAGWSLRAISRHDPDYLRWLMRHSSGVRYRQEIIRLLPKEVEPEARAARVKAAR